jgi:predicted AlkP superfamily pyrophosphatase or phosphodiesterase
MDKAKIGDEVHYSKRSFLKRAGTFLGGIVLGLPGLSALANVTATGITSQNHNDKDMPSKKLIFIAIDALHPNYLELDVSGNLGGKDGNRLMPNVRNFVNGSLWYTNAKAFLPAATDMNHLNALAGTSTAQNGIVGVWAQPVGWDEDGRIILKSSHLSLARDDNGKKVDTLFHAWKRKYPQSKTLLRRTRNRPRCSMRS